jgi:flagellar protein FliO/FliZ
LPYQADGLASFTLAAGVVVALLWAALWALRRLRPNGAAARHADCRVIRSLALGPREKLLVVSVGTKQLVLGVGASPISLLCELDEIAALSAAANSGFGDAFRKAREQWHRE